MLEVRDLNCTRDKRVLFDGLSFKAKSGDLIQIEGPNGAGKTSLLRIIAGLGLADKGEVCWQGVSIHAHREAFNQDLLYLGHHPGVKRELTAFENLVFYQKNQGDFDEKRLWDALTRAGLLGHEDVLAAHLSAGQIRRIALARLWLSNAKLWILDEPLTAIDKQGVKVLEVTFKEQVEKGGVILFTTHQDMFAGDSLLRRIRLGN